MVFVAVGTQKFPFDRLLMEMDKIVEKKGLNEKIFAQTGYSNFIPTNYEFKNFLGNDEFYQYVSQCDILITHSGVATIMTGLKMNKRVIVVPRYSCFGEHVDNHQLEIAQAFSEKNFVLLCDDINKLEELINKVRMHKFDKYISKRELMIKTIETYLNNSMLS